MKKKITVALTGNPNSGKTSVFNMLTGSRQHVGNYPGVTVEKVQGKRIYKDCEIIFVDLPGTYSLAAYSDEELIARHFIMDKKPDVVIDVVDASNIERNLYLAAQLIEMDTPLILAFNMADIAKQKGLVFDIERMSALLEAPIISTVATKNQGKEQLLDAIIDFVWKPRKPRTHTVKFNKEIEDEIEKIQNVISEQFDAETSTQSDDVRPGIITAKNTRWLAIKLLEQDTEITRQITSPKILAQTQKCIDHLTDLLRESPDILIADGRYGIISGACQETIKTTVEMRHSKSDAIDAVVTNRILGLPIFLVLMYVVFLITFKVGEYPMGWLESFFVWLGTSISSLWEPASASWLRSLLVDGIISGVGGVVVFLPNILILFAAIALLEGTGYMARAAFVMDRIMHKIGLHGKSFIPMLIGFGCSIPAIMATRILENKRNRFTTIMVIPLMSCGARLTIYGLIIPAFFPQQYRGLMMWLIYIIGIVLAVIAAKVLRLTVFKGDTTPFIMELPPYRLPTFKAIAIHMWQRGWMYLKKAGTIILAVSILLWIASNFPKPPDSAIENLDATQAKQLSIEYSVVGRVGKTIEPAIKPLGFDWKIGTALIGATAAKELFVSQMAIVYAVGEREEGVDALRATLQKNYSPLTGFCIMLFCLISAPCVATVAITKRETNSIKWALFQFLGLTALAYILTLIVYQLGSLFF